jgi:hypothetical protein
MDDVSRLAALAADVCFARNRSDDEAEKEALTAELQRYVALIAVARGMVSCVEAADLMVATALATPDIPSRRG